MAREVIVDVAGLSVAVLGPASELTQLLDGIDITVEAGCYVEVRGHSGSGKTTLLQTLAGIRPGARNATVRLAGSAIVAGVDVLAASDRERTALRRDQLTYIPQFSPVLGGLSIIQNMELPYLAAGLIPRSDLVSAALSSVALDLDPTQSAAVLSGGEQRRLAIAATLIAPVRPQVIVVDEPTAGLGIAERGVVLDLFRALTQRDGTAVISATHEDQVADRAIFLAGGGPALEPSRSIDQER